MTGANVINWSSVKSAQGLNANGKASGKTVGGAGITDSFASMMNANYAAGNAVKQPDGHKDSSAVSAKPAAAVSDRYGGRSKNAAESGLKDRITESSEELAGFEEAAVELIAEKLGVDAEQVQRMMEELGLTVYDLLNPQNLANLVMQLTGAGDAMELVCSRKFMELMQEMQTLGKDLMAELDLPMDQMDALIAEMDALETPAEVPQELPEGQTDLTQNMSGEGELTGEADIAAGTAAAEEDGNVQTAVQTSEAEENVSVKAEETADMPEEEAQEEEIDPVQVKTEGQSEGEETDSENPQASADKNRTTAANTTPQQTAAIQEPTAGPQSVFNELNAQVVSEISAADSAYMSAETLDMIEQVTQNLKVTVSEGLSSMEMTLNPEHLGKVFLQISAREGAVHAQIAAANEAVKNALEAQVAEIQENLSQAGVKVEAIEVTVASHEFERNLEQNQKREEQEGERAQENMGRRRNLNLTSLDELTGMMSEEEALVAQMMRDNGNSVDLSA